MKRESRKALRARIADLEGDLEAAEVANGQLLRDLLAARALEQRVRVALRPPGPISTTAVASTAMVPQQTFSIWPSV